MSESETLKPCPFCGSEAAVERFAEDWYDDESASYVRCTNQDCRASQWEDETSPYNKEQAIAAWNTRAGEHAAYERGKAEGAEAERGRLRAAVDEFRKPAIFAAEGARRTHRYDLAREIDLVVAGYDKVIQIIDQAE